MINGFAMAVRMQNQGGDRAIEREGRCTDARGRLNLKYGGHVPYHFQLTCRYPNPTIHYNRKGLEGEAMAAKVPALAGDLTNNKVRSSCGLGNYS